MKQQMKRPRVIISHPHAQHSYFLAAGVQRHGSLETYVTQLYYDKQRWPFRIVRYLAPRWQSRVDDLMFRRQLPDLDPSYVQVVNTWAPLTYIALNRLGLARRFREWWLLQTGKMFSKRVGNIVKKRADIFIGTDTASRDSFSIAKKANVMCVLDLAHPHSLTSWRIEEEERGLLPEFAATFSQPMIERREDLRYAVEEIDLADAIIAASSFSRSTLTENGVDPNRIYVVPYGVELDRFKPNRFLRHDDELHLLFVGAIGQRKGLSYLLEAVRHLRQKHNNNISLTLCGAMIQPGSYGQYKGDFRYIGRVLDSELPTVFSQADVFVFPSLLEGFGRVLLEAMASGVPVITTPNTAGPDIITDGVEGFIVPIRDIRSLIERIEFCYNHREICRQMGVAARKKADQYSWERYYHEIGKVIDDLWRQRCAG